eukprot:23692-Chlamydomonas_euryale.AAC.10
MASLQLLHQPHDSPCSKRIRHAKIPNRMVAGLLAYQLMHIRLLSISGAAAAIASVAGEL